MFFADFCAAKAWHGCSRAMLINYMFERLQKKWNVGGLRLILILFTFAIGGSATGYVAKKIMNSLPISEDWLWAVVYILLITIIWPLAVLIVSLPVGQFNFFTSYIKKIGQRMGIGSPKPELSGSISKTNQLITHHSPLITHIAIFASGAGSNAQKIIDHFKNNTAIKVSLIGCNNPDAGVLKIAEKEDIPSIIIHKEKFFRGNGYVDELKDIGIDFIVLAGFLWKLPPVLINTYSGRIVNIHPALLPKYGGKGMYGSYVHEAVIAAKEKETGITIHFVDELYDHGNIIFQAKCPVLPEDTPGSLAKRIHELEHEHYAKEIEKLILSKKS